MKRDNPFVDADLLAKVTSKVKTHAADYTMKIQEELEADALASTMLHIGNTILTQFIPRRRSTIRESTSRQTSCIIS
jgi:spore coat polysaccharide biosynthesis protein SpsF (cytidylyltransferase family)